MICGGMQAKRGENEEVEESPGQEVEKEVRLVIKTGSGKVEGTLYKDELRLRNGDGPTPV